MSSSGCLSVFPLDENCHTVTWTHSYTMTPPVECDGLAWTGGVSDDPRMDLHTACARLALYDVNNVGTVQRQ